MFVSHFTGPAYSGCFAQIDHRHTAFLSCKNTIAFFFFNGWVNLLAVTKVSL